MSLRDFLLRPELAPLLLAAPLAWIALRAADRRADARTASQVGPRVGELADASPRRRAARRGACASILLLAAVAALEPAWGDAESQHSVRGVDVVVCLDVSRSMLARDVAPSRLDAAKRGIARIGDLAAGDRLALVVFAGDAHAAVPLTQDKVSYAQILARADTLSASVGGTNLAAAIDAALELLDGGTGEHETIVVVTDGEDLAGEGLRAAARCRARGVTVHCVGVGSPLGGRIPVEGRDGETWLRGPDGAEVVTRMDAASLERLAAAAGGRWFDAGRDATAFERLHEEAIAPIARKALDDERRRTRTRRFQAPLLGVVLLGLLAIAVSDRRGGAR